jgi:hypothetical protein
MGSLKFELIVYGGIADDPEPRVAADRMGDVLKGMTQDVQEICRNLSVETGSTLLDERIAECRLYVEGSPRKGNSVPIPMAISDSAFAVRSIRAFATGVAELRESKDLGSTALPEGFDAPILRRVKGYCQGFVEEHSGFHIAVPARNGTPAIKATFDARLKTAVDIKLALIEREQTAEDVPLEKPDKRIYGYSVQGVLHELDDPNVLDSAGKFIVGIDSRDGLDWICRLDKQVAPANLQNFWRTEVLVKGTATMRPRRPILEADQFVPLPGYADPVKALDELVGIYGSRRGEPVQDFMDRIRERD